MALECCTSFGCFFSPRTKTQENRSSPLCDIISVFHLPAKQACTERDGILFSQNAWFTYSFWMYNNKSDPESGRALHRIPFFNNHCLEWVSEKKEQIGLIFQILTVYACFMGEWNSKMTSQSKPDPFSSIVVHGPQNPLTSLLRKVTTEGKIHNPKRECMSAFAWGGLHSPIKKKSPSVLIWNLQYVIKIEIEWRLPYVHHLDNAMLCTVWGTYM